MRKLFGLEVFVLSSDVKVATTCMMIPQEKISILYSVQTVLSFGDTGGWPILHMSYPS